MSFVDVTRQEAEDNYTIARETIEKTLEVLARSGNTDPVFQVSVLTKNSPYGHDEATFLLATAITMLHRVRTLEGS